jgi:hypothetical protein
MTTSIERGVECMTLADLPGMLGRDPQVRAYSPWNHLHLELN